MIQEKTNRGYLEVIQEGSERTYMPVRASAFLDGDGNAVGGDLPAGVQYLTASATLPDWDSPYPLAPDTDMVFTIPTNKSWWMDITVTGKRTDTGELAQMKVIARIKNVADTLTITSQALPSQMSIGGAVLNTATVSVAGTTVTVNAELAANTSTTVKAFCTVYEM